MLPKLKSSLALIFLIFLMLWCITLIRAGRMYYDGTDALSKHKFLDAITCFERSGLYFAPFNPFQKRSLIALIKISKEKDSAERVFSAQAGNAAVRVFNQTGPWANPADYGINSVKQNFPWKKLTITALIHISFWGWIAFTILFFFMGFDKGGAFSPVRGSAAILTALLCLAAWLSLIRHF